MSVERSADIWDISDCIGGALGDAALGDARELFSFLPTVLRSCSVTGGDSIESGGKEMPRVFYQSRGEGSGRSAIVIHFMHHMIDF